MDHPRAPPEFGLWPGIIVLSDRPDAWTVTGIVLDLMSMRITLSQHGTAGGDLHRRTSLMEIR